MRLGSGGSFASSRPRGIVAQNFQAPRSGGENAKHRVNFGFADQFHEK
jgi:hypothetical protein